MCIRDSPNIIYEISTPYFCFIRSIFFDIGRYSNNKKMTFPTLWEILNKNPVTNIIQVEAAVMLIPKEATVQISVIILNSIPDKAP